MKEPHKNVCHFVFCSVLLCLTNTAAADHTHTSGGDYSWLDDFYQNFSEALDDSATWVDSNFEADTDIDRQARAWARVQVGVQPKSGDWSHFPVRFRIKMRLPNLEDKVDLILSDNELDDFERLPLESSRPNDNISNSEDFSAAIRLVHQSDDDSFISSRVGFGRGSIYARSFYRWRKRMGDHTTILLQPAVEYWLNDGFGARHLTEVSYQFTPNKEVRFSHSIWYVNHWKEARWKQGLYYVQQFANNDALVAGVLMEGRVDPKYEEEKISASVRWRTQFLRSWLFFEVEPFVDFEEANNFHSSIGIALRVEGYFGYKHH